MELNSWSDWEMYHFSWWHGTTSGIKFLKMFLLNVQYLLVQDMSRKLGPNPWTVFSTNTLRKAEDLMPRDIMSSEPRHWMVFVQLVMSVQCCAEARRRCLSTALHSHDKIAKYHPVPWLGWHNVSWHQIFCNQPALMFWGRGETGTLPLGQDFRTAWDRTG